jgi:hypothetical protein
MDTTQASIGPTVSAAGHRQSQRQLSHGLIPPFGLIFIAIHSPTWSGYFNFKPTSHQTWDTVV